jgi:alpha-2-macroglobulin
VAESLTLAAHPDMIPDLRAYTVYALATTGGAPKDALDKAWDSRDKLSDEGWRCRAGARCRRRCSRAKEAAVLLEKKAK